MKPLQEGLMNFISYLNYIHHENTQYQFLMCNVIISQGPSAKPVVTVTTLIKIISIMWLGLLEWNCLSVDTNPCIYIKPASVCCLKKMTKLKPKSVLKIQTISHYGWTIMQCSLHLQRLPVMSFLSKKYYRYLLKADLGSLFCLFIFTIQASS